ncbi:hypothetical protein CPB83DRAFT_903249 [Crepidotus variabilis]|uniref:Uncharacterized protein n=1 Tax=Crepidotus variabilis TaxID=179855 RepID=A0A9P6ERE7_9AGAR|nr:hypothetical protein CPB83DRAFT_903249 [Crepidotus variabilis]
MSGTSGKERNPEILVFFTFTLYTVTLLASPSSANIDARGPLNAGFAAHRSPQVPSLPDPRELTNAAHLALGLPPRLPIFRRFLPGKRTPTIAARDPTPSIITVSGKIQVNRADNGAFVGYVSKNYFSSANRKC